MVASRGCWCIVLEPVQAPHSCQDMWVRSQGGAAGCDLPDPPSLHLACTTITTHSNSNTYMHEAPCYGPRAPGSRPRALSPEPRASAPGPGSRALMHTYRHGCMYGWGVIHTHIHGCMHACWAAPDPRKMLICLYVCTHTYKHINLFQDAGMHAASAGRELPGDAGCLLAKLSSGSYDPPQWQSRRHPHPPRRSRPNGRSSGLPA